MILVVGLGNPGQKYKKTRHNLGFMIVESLKLKVKSFSNWKCEKKFQAEISKGKIFGQKVILAKPQTFMNNSGKAVKSLLSLFQKLDNFAIAELSSYLYVIHDDIDLPLKKIRISIGRGSAGHKGVESIIQELKTKNFVRFRIGIRPQSKISTRVEKIDRFVLQKFSKDEERIVKEVIKKTVRVIEFAIKKGVEKARQKYNKYLN